MTKDDKELRKRAAANLFVQMVWWLGVLVFGFGYFVPYLADIFCGKTGSYDNVEKLAFLSFFVCLFFSGLIRAALLSVSTSVLKYGRALKLNITRFILIDTAFSLLFILNLSLRWLDFTQFFIALIIPPVIVLIQKKHSFSGQYYPHILLGIERLFTYLAATMLLIRLTLTCGH